MGFGCTKTMSGAEAGPVTSRYSAPSMFEAIWSPPKAGVGPRFYVRCPDPNAGNQSGRLSILIDVSAEDVPFRHSRPGTER